MNDNDDFPAGFIIFLIIVLGGSVFCIGMSQGIGLEQKQAILNGAAHYVVDSQGEPKFTWNK